MSVFRENISHLRRKTAFACGEKAANNGSTIPFLTDREGTVVEDTQDVGLFCRIIRQHQSKDFRDFGRQYEVCSNLALQLALCMAVGLLLHMLEH